MVRLFSILLAAALSCTVFAQQHTVLYEQMTSHGLYAYSSQNLDSTLDIYDCRGADDFFVPIGDWYWIVYRVSVLGYYYGTGPANSVNVYFYSDSAGLPGSIIYEGLNLIPDSGLAEGSFSIPLLELAWLYEGSSYWVSVEANMDSIAGEWGWMEQEGNGNQSAWQNPGGGFAQGCLSWGHRVSDCSLGDFYYPDFSFRLMGAYFIPVEMASFNAILNENIVELTWSTATEKNNRGFEIERNSEGAFSSIGFIQGNGTTTETQYYSYTDEEVEPGKYQYKLKQIDYDGTFEYSQIVEVEIPFVNEFSLSQNFPNPFNPVTQIKYSIPQSPLLGGARGGLVTLKVYDLLGREITTIVNEEKPAGEYEVEFNAANLPSGIYFYQLNAGQYSETKKMVLLR